MLTRPQRELLRAMYYGVDRERHATAPRRFHCVHDLGFRMPVLVALVRAGLAEFGKHGWGGVDEYRGKLTPAGRAHWRELMRGKGRG